MTRTMTLLAVIAVAGCSGGSKVEDFTPPEAKARQALEKALAHWQGGGKPGAVPGTSAPVIEVTDSKWAAGQKLKGYEVLGDEPPAGAGPRLFKVKLTPPAGPAVETKYAVLGIDPLLVYRDEDYQKLSGTGK